MADVPPRKKKKGSYSGNHQRSWLWGHHAVCETLESGKWPVLEIFASKEAHQQHTVLLQTKQNAGIPVEIVDYSRLEQLTHSTEHQGLIARLGAFPYCASATFEELLKAAMANFAEQPGNAVDTASEVPLVVICDRIQDAYNFGAILRCCDGAKVTGVIVGDRNQAEVTPHVARSSAGAVNHIPITRVHSLADAIHQVKHLGLQVVAADANARSSIWETSLTTPTALLVGSEAHGIQQELLSLCDHKIIIPMLGHVTSLNVAVATGILLYEIRRQQFTRS
jgi:23S rRNA (guanosine2251-2'-O)-methyltransferase